MSETSYADLLKDWERLNAASLAEGTPELLSRPDLDVAGIRQELRSAILATPWREAEIEHSHASGRATTG